MREAFIDLFDRDYRLVVRFLMRCGISLEDSKDAAQEAFIAGWQLLTQRPEEWMAIAEPRGWIRTVALRAYHRPPGQRRRQVPIAWDEELPQQPASGGNPAGPAILHRDLLFALSSLPKSQRIAMAFRLDDMPSTATAAHLGITEQQANYLLKKARASLKSSLTAYRIREGDRR
ncbi:sigma-70 family RNA polymerase sigma factor [Streptosporangium roseum]|uniref:sigma-70 family RNA polymerase sigma factor n=1 Tax=Streptosporangium roseum TaxID=2001 RepID=UPI0004CCD38C|nr:sigma-70 family RNA polymerase sigma factor [Streptosporangium roseum]